MRKRTACGLASALVLLLTAGCGAEASPAASTGSPSDSSTPTSGPPAVTSSTPAVPKSRTKAELTNALVGLDDLPAGFTTYPDEGDDGSRFSSAESRCAAMLRLFNARTTPGAKLSVHRLLSGGQNGPVIEETLEWFGSARAAGALIDSARTAVRACPRATFTLTGSGTSPVTVSEVSAPTVGSDPFAVRFAAGEGPLAGFETTFVLIGVGDVVLSMLFVGAQELDDPVKVAHTKAAKTLRTA